LNIYKFYEAYTDNVQQGIYFDEGVKLSEFLSQTCFPEQCEYIYHFITRTTPQIMIFFLF